MGNENSQPGKRIENDIKVNWRKESTSCPFAPREGQAAAIVGSTLYLFGGVMLQSHDDEEMITESDELIVYDIANKKWSKEVCSGEYPGQRSGATMTNVKSKLYLFGGLSQLSGWMNDLYMFNTVTKAWTKIEAEQVPSPRDKVTSCTVGSKIYIFGGFGPVEDVEPDADDILVDDDDDEYEDMDELQEVRNCQEAANFTWSNQLYVFDIDSEQWSVVMAFDNKAPSPRAAHSLSLVKENDGNDYLYVFGGRDAQSRRCDLWRFDINKSAWEECKCYGCAPPARSFHAAVSVGPRIVIYGGRGVRDQHFNDLHIFDTTTKEWLQPVTFEQTENEAIAPPAMGLHSLCASEKEVVLFGGSNDLDPATGTCVKIYNDAFSIPIKQLLQGGSIKEEKGTQEHGDTENLHVPGLLNLKPKAENNVSKS